MNPIYINNESELPCAEIKFHQCSDDCNCNKQRDESGGENDEI